MNNPEITHNHAGGATPDRLLVTAREAAEAFGKSVRTWRRWNALGLIPSPVRIGRNALWPKAELTAWIEARCPRREQWEAMQTRKSTPSQTGDAT